MSKPHSTGSAVCPGMCRPDVARLCVAPISADWRACCGEGTLSVLMAPQRPELPRARRASSDGATDRVRRLAELCRSNGLHVTAITQITSTGVSRLQLVEENPVKAGRSDDR